MIKVVYSKTEQRPYADTKHHYDVVALNGETEEEVRKYCTESVHRCPKSAADDRHWSETYYLFQKNLENRYHYTVIVPNCC